MCVCAASSDGVPQLSPRSLSEQVEAVRVPSHLHLKSTTVAVPFQFLTFCCTCLWYTLWQVGAGSRRYDSKDPARCVCVLLLLLLLRPTTPADSVTTSKLSCVRALLQHIRVVLGFPSAAPFPG
jgi:hypothetical protein